MTSDFTALANPWLSDTNDYINEIYDIFNRHWMTLDNERQSEIDTIDNWCRDSTKHLKTYAKEQKCLLNIQYDRLRLVLDEKNQENLETANAYHTTKKVDLFKQLRDECQRLEFQVVKLEFIKRKITYPKVITVEEQTERNNQQPINTEISKNSEQRRNSIGNDRNTTEDTTSESASSSAKSTALSSKKARRQQSKTRSEKENDQSTGNIDDSGSIVSNNNCPICYMIFPSNMKRNSRLQHVNEHYTDD